MTIRVLVVDDSAKARQALQALLEAQADLLVVGTAMDPLFAERKLEKLRPDVLLLDHRMPRMTGLAFLARLMDRQPLPVVFCSITEDLPPQVAAEAWSLGAASVVGNPGKSLEDFLKEAGQSIVQAVRNAASRRSWVQGVRASTLSTPGGQASSPTPNGSTPAPSDASIPGSGLPPALASLAGGARPIPQGITPGRPIQVFIVDDSAVVRQRLQEFLSREPGIRVSASAADPVFAVRKMEKEWPDVILLDAEMPRMDGLAFLRRLMASAPLPVILCCPTSQPSEELLSEAIRLGAYAAFTNPEGGLEAFFKEQGPRLLSAIRVAGEKHKERSLISPPSLETLLAPGPVEPPSAQGQVPPRVRPQPSVPLPLQASPGKAAPKPPTRSEAKPAPVPAAVPESRPDPKPNPIAPVPSASTSAAKAPAPTPPSPPPAVPSAAEVSTQPTFTQAVGASSQHHAGGPIRVLIVDDSAVVRQVMQEILARDKGIRVIDQAMDPLFALQKMEKEWPDVILLDVEMPRMDGITFLKKIMAERPTPVIICSSLTEKGAETTLQAMSAGAFAIFTKPQLGVRGFLKDASEDLVQSVYAAAGARMAKALRLPLAKPKEKLSADAVLASGGGAMVATTDKLTAIGTSTGGTQALEYLLAQLPRGCPGIVVVQHMPEAFTAAFAQRLNTLCEIEVREAQTGDRIRPGLALIAPGGRHLMVKRSGAQYLAEVVSAPPVNRHCPSVDVLFRSVANQAGRNATGVLMTGMGDDGARGLLEMKESGSRTIAQDEASCVVFGMPKEAIKLGAAQRVLSLQDIPDQISRG